MIKLTMSMTIIIYSDLTYPEALWWLQFLKPFLTYYSILLVYIAVDELFNATVPQSVHIHKLFPVIIAGSFLTFLFQFQLRDDLIAFLSEKPLYFSTTLYAYYAIKGGFQFFLILLIVRLYWRNLHNYVKLTYFVRRCICLLGCILGLVYIITINFPIISFLLTGYIIHLYIGQAQWILKVLPLWFLLIGFTVPNTVLSFILRPLEKLFVHREKRKQALLSYLHEQLLLITPNVSLPYESAKNMRILIEIRDARQIILSHYRFTDQITPVIEARYLFGLLTEQVILHETGPYQLLLDSQHNNSFRYDQVVAKQLLRLQQKENQK